MVAEPVADSVAESATVDPATDWLVLDQARAQMLSILANQLDSIGKRLMQASDLLSSWADMQIASRESAVR